MSAHTPRKARPTLTQLVPKQSAESIPIDSFVPARWRLLITGPADGATNMAIDEAIAEAVRAGKSPPTLRFYGWQPPALSLGIAQEADVVDEARCAILGWQLVRRPTGGRAVLHIDELTYAVIAPETEPRVKGGVVESYRRLSVALTAGLRELGVVPERTLPYYADRGAAGPACFDGPSDYEVTIAQRKLIGSAQMRRAGVVLQHGSLPLAGDVTRVCEGLRFESEGQRLALRNRLRWRATTLAEALGGAQIAAESATDALIQGFATTLALTFSAETLTEAEADRAEQIRVAKYANDAWTYRK